MCDRLIELIEQYTENITSRDLHKADFDEKFADYLLANGVIVPPCKVGDTVYIQNGKIGTVTSIHQNLIGKEVGRWVVTAWFENYYGDTKIEGFECGSNKTFYFADFGKTVFLTRDEAEAALKESGKR